MKTLISYLGNNRVRGSGGLLAHVGSLFRRVPKDSRSRYQLTVFENPNRVQPTNLNNFQTLHIQISGGIDNK